MASGTPGAPRCGPLSMQARLLLAGHTGRQDLIDQRGEEGQNGHILVRDGWRWMTELLYVGVCGCLCWFKEFPVCLPTCIKICESAARPTPLNLLPAADALCQDFDNYKWCKFIHNKLHFSSELQITEDSEIHFRSTNESSVLQLRSADKDQTNWTERYCMG